MKTKWTFNRILKEAAKKDHGWHHMGDGAIRSSKGLCPLGVVFTPRRKNSPAPDEVPVNRLVAYRIAYAADTRISPDREALEEALGLR